MGFPVVDSVSPSSGPRTGGTAVTILGRNFTGVTSVSFDGTPATSFTVVDDNTITAVTPTGASSGPVIVVLVNADGSSDGGIILNDSSGNAHDGTYTFSAPGYTLTFEPGLVAGGEAGSPAAFQVSDAIVDPSDSFTIEYWASSTGSAEVGINGAAAGGSDFGVSAPVTSSPFDGVVQMGVGSPGFSASFNSLADPDPGIETPFPTDGDSHHVVLVYERSGSDGAISLYIDGSFIVTQSSAPGGAGSATAVGLSLSGAQTGAAIDELAVYPYALSSGDIAANFAAASDYAAYAAQILSLSPTAYYRFDDDRANGGFEYSPLGGYLGMVGGPDPCADATLVDSVQAAAPIAFLDSLYGYTQDYVTSPTPRTLTPYLIDPVTLAIEWRSDLAVTIDADAQFDLMLNDTTAIFDLQVGTTSSLIAVTHSGLTLSVSGTQESITTGSVPAHILARIDDTHFVRGYRTGTQSEIQHLDTYSISGGTTATGSGPGSSGSRASTQSPTRSAVVQPLPD